jgi:hypothetical protein
VVPHGDGPPMLAALEINFALWGMIICASIKLTHLLA